MRTLLSLAALFLSFALISRSSSGLLMWALYCVAAALVPLVARAIRTRREK